jgi:hypothetical protein
MKCRHCFYRLLVIVFSLLPMIVSFIIDSKLLASWHGQVIGGLAIVFGFLDMTFWKARDTINCPNEATCVTCRESERIDLHVRKTRSLLTKIWVGGIGCKVMALILGIVYANTQCDAWPHFLAWFLGHLLISSAIYLAIFFWATFQNAEDFRDRMRLEQKQELARREVLKDVHSIVAC